MAKPSAVSRAQKSKARDSGPRQNETGRWRGPCPERALQERNAEAHHAPRGREPRRARAEGDAGARSTGATTETADHEPPEASASVLTTQARGHRGRRREARTTQRRGLAARSRKADPNRQGPRSGPQTKRDQASGAKRTRPRKQTRPARFMTAPPRARGACGHGGGSENRPRKPRTNARARRACLRT